MIPQNLFRTVPEVTNESIEQWWNWSKDIHQGWNCITYRDPLNPTDFPITSPFWDSCQHGAQMAGLIRLELVFTHGGVYIDSDVTAQRSFGPLLDLRCFAGWEDEFVIPDAIFGAEAGHPAIEQALNAATFLVSRGHGPWETGPGVFTDIFPGRRDVTLFPPQTFYPYHYSEKKDRRKVNANYGKDPWCYAVHHWNASWVK